MDRLTVVSADCHADPAEVDGYGPYLEAEYQDDYAAYVADLRAVLADVGQGTGHDRTAFFSSDHHAKLEAAVGGTMPTDGAASTIGSNLSLTSDPDVRLRDLEADGVVAEVIFVNAAWPFAPTGISDFRQPPRDDGSSGRERELQTAGKRAYHRWLGELCQAHPGRRVGVGVLYPIDDVQETIDDLELMRSLGVGAVMCPPPVLSAPALWDRCLDPVWAKLAELDMPVHLHAGWGEKLDPRVSLRRPDSPEFDPGVQAISDIEMFWYPRRALWLLTFGGVLDRHPGLKVVFTELNADWVPTYLRQMDGIYDDYLRSARKLNQHLSMPPSEFWKRQCFVGASSISRNEVALRDEIGLETMMFGTDYPHNEGTWPTTVKWLQRAFEDIPEADVRAILGGNAIRCYGLDAEQLAAAAATCGPSVEDVVRGAKDLDEADVKWLDDRGASRPVAFI
ncbi:MAG: amidohydrolase [Actinomycetia bacterium]|nr:amidohydrolase [Actinomycetes bacterium]